MIEYRYREAHARLDAVKAKAAFERGQTVCRFFDERGNEVGEALILSWDGAGLCLEHSGSCFEETSGRAGWTGRMDFQTIEAAKANNTGKRRTYLLCPACRRPFGILIYKGKWGCGGCLKLGYRSQFISPDVSASARLAEMQEKFGRGRPRWMRQEAYRKAVSEMAALKRTTRAFPSVPSVAHQRVIHGTWHTPAEVGHLLHSDFEIVDGAIRPAKWRLAKDNTSENRPTAAQAGAGKLISPILPNLSSLTDEDVFNQDAPFDEL